MYNLDIAREGVVQQMYFRLKLYVYSHPYVYSCICMALTNQEKLFVGEQSMALPVQRPIHEQDCW